MRNLAAKEFPEIARPIQGAKEAARQKQGAGRKSGGRGQKKLGGHMIVKFAESAEAIGATLGMSRATEDSLGITDEDLSF